MYAALGIAAGRARRDGCGRGAASLRVGCSLDRAADAHRESENRHLRGKIVLVP